MTPRIWTRNDIISVISAEIKEYRGDCLDRGIPIADFEMAELIYEVLNENGLIEHTP